PLQRGRRGHRRDPRGDAGRLVQPGPRCLAVRPAALAGWGASTPPPHLRRGGDPVTAFPRVLLERPEPGDGRRPHTSGPARRLAAALARPAAWKGLASVFDQG